MDAKKVIAKRYGPFRGVVERGEKGQFQDAWNVDFEADGLRSRGGRHKLITTWTLFPQSVVREAVSVETGSTWTVGTEAMSDGDTTTTFAIGSTDSTDYIHVFFNTRFSSIVVTIGTANTTTAALTVEYYDTTSGWTAVSGLSDGTSSGGKTFAQNGTISWTMPSNWRPVPMGVWDGRGFWVRLKVNATLSAGTTLTSITTTLTSGNGLLFQCNGLYQWHLPDGQRWQIVAMDSRDPFQGRLFVWDRQLSTLRPIQIAEIVANDSGPDARWRFATLAGVLLACNGYRLLVGAAADPYKMQNFTTAIPLVEGSSIQHEPPVSAKFIAVFDGVIYVAGMKEDPYTVRHSQPAGLHFDIDESFEKNLPMGGAHLWDRNSFFTVQDAGGGSITGMAVVGDTLLVFCPRATVAWNGYAPRTLDGEVGCVAPDSLATVNDRAFFVGPGGIYMHRQGVNTLISRDIAPTIEGLNQLALSRAVGVVYGKKKQYRLYVPSRGLNRNDLVLVYNYETGGWTKYGEPSWIPSTATGLQPYEVALADAPKDEAWNQELLEVDYDGNAWLADYGSKDDTKSILAIAVSDKLSLEDGDLHTVRKVISQLGTEWGGEVLNLALLVDGESWQTYDATNGIFALSGEEDISLLPAAGSGYYYKTGASAGITFASGSWAARKLVSRSTSFGRNARWFQLVWHNERAASANHSGKPFWLSGYEAEALPRPGRRT